MGECFLYGHSYEDILLLCNDMRQKWQQGLSYLMKLDNCGDYAKAEQQWVAGALSILFDSGTNTLQFYHLREQLGLGQGNGMHSRA